MKFPLLLSLLCLLPPGPCCVRAAGEPAGPVGISYLNKDGDECCIVAGDPELVRKHAEVPQGAACWKFSLPATFFSYLEKTNTRLKKDFSVEFARLPKGPHPQDSSFAFIYSIAAFCSCGRAQNVYFLDFSALGMEDVGLFMVCEALRATSVNGVNPEHMLLRKLDLQGNKLTDRALGALMCLPEIFPSLSYVDLSDNDLTYAALSQLIKKYCSNSKVACLDISGNLITQEQEAQLLYEIASNLQMPSDFILLNSKCSAERLEKHFESGVAMLITDEAISIYERSGAQSVLKSIPLSHPLDSKNAFQSLHCVFEEFSKEGKEIRDCLLRIKDPLKGLKILDVVCNEWIRLKLQNACDALYSLDVSGLKGLEDPQTLRKLLALVHFVGVQELVAQDCDLDAEALRGLLSAMNGDWCIPQKGPVNTSLRVLDLRENPVGLAQAQAARGSIPDFFAHRPHLDLVIKVDPSSPEGCESVPLKAAFKNPSLGPVKTAP